MALLRHRTWLLLLCIWLVRAPQSAFGQVDAPPYWAWTQTPPMGWNSWLCFGTSVTETQAKAAADYMATNLKQFGYQYVVVDIDWYDPFATGYTYRANATLTMDSYGRLLPAPNRFPSGFQALADYCHAKGLKFGIHALRGIPHQAYNLNSQILGTNSHAQDIVDTGPAAQCSWNSDMYAIDISRPGAQGYYNSLANLWASWGVDLVKIDDLTGDAILNPLPYHAGELEAIRAAIDQSGRAMVLSTSPGYTPVGQGGHIMFESNIFRVGPDLWDVWSTLRNTFDLMRNWTSFRGPGHFPDGDLLPLGKLGAGNADPNAARTTNLTVDEQYTLMSFWSIARSPLMYGGDLTQMDSFTLGLITNPEAIAVNQNSYGNHELFNQSGLYAWVANVPNSTDKYLAVFNTNDSTGNGTGTTVAVNLASVGFTGSCQIRDLWQRTNIGAFMGQFAPQIRWHGAGLYRVSGTYSPVPPGTISGLGGNHQITLSWDSAVGATSYTVSRAGSSGGPYASIASGVTGTNYVDQGLTNGTPYYYVVSATTPSGLSSNSTEATAVPMAPCPGNWQTVDIGYPSSAGAAGFSDGIFTLRAGGDDIWNAADSFRFCWQHMNGDGTLIARVRSVSHSDDWAKAGVMFREDGTAGARYAFMFVTAGGQIPPQAALQYRNAPSGSANGVYNTTDADSLRWVKLVRKGITFYGYYSSDGVSWSGQSVPFTMASNVLAGLAVTAHNNTTITTAAFDFVSFIPASSIPADGSLRVLQWLRSGSSALLVIPSQTGKNYQLQRQPTFPPGTWQSVGLPQSGTGDLLTFFDSSGATGNRQFYRVSGASQSAPTGQVFSRTPAR